MLSFTLDLFFFKTADHDGQLLTQQSLILLVQEQLLLQLNTMIIVNSEIDQKQVSILEASNEV